MNSTFYEFINIYYSNNSSFDYLNYLNSKSSINNHHLKDEV